MQLLYKTGYFVIVGAMLSLGALLLLSITSVPWAPKVKVVKSGSMEPSIPVGAIVLVERENTYKIGDVITFGKDTKSQIPTTHRIVAIQGEGSAQMFQTKGDANNAPDPSATNIKDVEGRALVAVPYIGYLLAFARTKLGFSLLVGLPALLILIEEGYAIWRELNRMRRGRRRVIQTRAPVVVRVQPTELPAHTKLAVRRVKMMDGIKPAATAMLGLVLVAGLVYASGRASGDTLAHFASNQSSKNNTFQAGVFPPPADPQVAALDFGTQNIQDTPADPPPADPPADSPPSDTTVTVSDAVTVVSSPDSSIEISDPSTVIE